MKTVKSLEECGLSIKVVSETIKNKEKQQKWRSVRMLISPLSVDPGNISVVKAQLEQVRVLLE